MLRFGLIIILLSLTNPTQATYILVLGDDNSESFVSPYLTNQGHTVTSNTAYYDWEAIYLHLVNSLYIYMDTNMVTN